jgi:hypothetical protein
MTTSGKRVRALRKGERRGSRSFTIGMSEDDLRVIAKHGYEGVISSDPDQRARIFLACRPLRPRGIRTPSVPDSDVGMRINRLGTPNDPAIRFTREVNFGAT